MKKFFRTLQTHFNFLHDLRYDIQYFLRRITNSVHEEEFNAIEYFRPDINQVFLDIGSNRGEAITSILIINKGKNKIIGFEPNPFIFEKLQKRHGKRANVRLLNFGVADIAGEFKLFVPFYRRWMFDGLSSFDLTNPVEWMPKNMWNFKKVKLSIKEVTCKVLSIDELNFNPYFIKIDVQGYETKVLQGAINTLRQYKPILLIETLLKEHREILTPMGYDYFHFKNGNFVRGEGEVNTLCISKDKLHITNGRLAS